MDRTMFNKEASGAVRADDDRVLRARIHGEYQEMPGLSLTLPQAARLFNLELAECARVLNALVTEGTLWTNGCTFVGANIGRRCA